MRIATIKAVAECQLCTGCGACAGLAPERYRMEDVKSHGRRPILVDAGKTAVAGGPSEAELLAICPGVGLAHNKSTWPEGIDRKIARSWGPVLKVWKGYAADARVRFEGSSGGIATVIALSAVDDPRFGGVLHTRSKDGEPWRNTSVLSRTPSDVLAANGSRYAPASPVDRIGELIASDRPCVFVGKPCDVAAVHSIVRANPAVSPKVGLTVAIFCAGTPTWEGTIEMLAEMGISDPTTVASLRYRGHGWPGHAAARTSDGTERRLTYDESWNRILQRHRQWRCYLCPDHSGEFADISLGDPWHEPPAEGAAGESLIVARTERGRAWIERLIACGAIVAAEIGQDALEASQPNLLRVRGSVWGRLAALALARVPRPRFQGIPMLPSWLAHLSVKGKLQSIFGTFRRISRRRLRDRVEFEPLGSHRSR